MALVQYSDNGFFAPRTIADAFRTTSDEVGRTAGLGKDAVQHKQRVRSDKTMADVVHKVEPCFGSTLRKIARLAATN